MSRETTIQILLVEDSQGDAELMTEALTDESELSVCVTVIDDGEDALDYLRGSSQPLPDLILLDLHLPRKSGREILQEIKQCELTQAIPVVVFTSIESDQLIEGVCDLPATCCVRKPANLEQLTLVVQTIESFWLRQKQEQHPHPLPKT